MAVDFLIVGQGLAGNLLALELKDRGATILIVDPGDLHSASRVAPGIINPLAGKKLHPVWRVDDHLPCAVDTYSRIGTLLEQKFFHPTPIIRVIKDSTQAGLLQERAAQPEAAQFIGETLGPGQIGPPVHDPFGSFIARGSGWLDTAQIIASLRQHWHRDGLISPTLLSPGKVQPDGDTIRWNGKAFGCCVFCEGWQAGTNEWFSWIPWTPARGEMLDLHTQDAPFMPPHLEGCILNRGQWLLPLGNGYYRAGASYAWDDFEAPPSREKEEEILQSIHSLVDVSFSVVGHKTGVRPAISDRFPVLGRHPDHPQIALLNGFGSKGVLVGPWLARQLADHLLNDTPLPHEVDAQRFL